RACKYRRAPRDPPRPEARRLRGAVVIGTTRAMETSGEISGRLGKNIKQLREARGLTQQQIAKLAGVPRAARAHLESGDGAPTPGVLHRAAGALQVSIEELISSPRAACRLYARDTLPTRSPGQVLVRKLLPDPIPGMEIDRIEIAPAGR